MQKRKKGPTSGFEDPIVTAKINMNFSKSLILNISLIVRNIMEIFQSEKFWKGLLRNSDDDKKQIKYLKFQKLMITLFVFLVVMDTKYIKVFWFQPNHGKWNIVHRCHRRNNDDFLMKFSFAVVLLEQVLGARSAAVGLLSTLAPLIR